MRLYVPLELGGIASKRGIISSVGSERMRHADRRRVGLRKAFRAAVGTSKEGVGGVTSSTEGDIVGVIVFTLEWWVTGVPVDVLEREDIS